MKVIGLKGKNALTDRQIAEERQKMVDYDVRVNMLMGLHKIDHLQVARYLDGLGYDGHCAQAILDALKKNLAIAAAGGSISDLSGEVSGRVAAGRVGCPPWEYDAA